MAMIWFCCNDGTGSTGAPSKPNRRKPLHDTLQWQRLISVNNKGFNFVTFAKLSTRHYRYR